MNITHLKYAAEVAKTGSVTRAAENLYMSQPNLSKAVKELEGSLGITIFKRTAKGLIPTKKGEEFLLYAKNVIAQIDEMEVLYGARAAKKKKTFRVSVPRSGYIGHAFSGFVKTLPLSIDYHISLNEADLMEIINAVADGDYPLGVVRCRAEHEPYFASVFQERGIEGETVWEYEYMAVMPRSHPLAQKEKITPGDLNDYIEVTGAEVSLPFLPVSEMRKLDKVRHSTGRVYIYERGSRLDFLARMPQSYMFSAPLPRDLLNRFDLTQKACPDNGGRFRDLLIRLRGYKLSELDLAFKAELIKTRDEITASL